MGFLNPYTMVEIPLLELMINLAIGLVLAVIWSVVIGRTTRLMVDGRQYLPVFILLVPSMILIISIIKSSIALSLGLVGALSIVRFRTPIKEPEELLYLFVAIAIGLGLGANQVLPTVIGFFVIVLALIPFTWARNKTPASFSNMVDIVIANGASERLDALAVEKAVQSLGTRYKVKRVTTTDDRLEMLLETPAMDMARFTALERELKRAGGHVEISVMDNARVIT